MKKWVAMLLCLLLCAGMAVPAVAEDEAFDALEIIADEDVDEAVGEADADIEVLPADADIGLIALEEIGEAADEESFAGAVSNKTFAAAEEYYEEETARAEKTNASSDDFDIEDGVLVRYNGSDTNVVIPSGVTSIGYSAFGFSDLKSVKIPDSVKYIDEFAFGWCESLTSVTLPSGLTKIETDVFTGCKSLTGVKIPSGVKEIGDGAFRYCESLKSLSLPSGVTSIGDEAFYGCTSLTSVTIPPSVKLIGRKAFGNCSGLKSVKILAKKVESDKYPFGDYSWDWERLACDLSIVCDSKAVSWAEYEGYSVKLIHEKVIDPAVDATYTAAGKTEGSHCSVCGKVIKAQKAIPVKTLPANGLLMTKSLSKKGNIGQKWQIVLNTGAAKSYKSDNTAVAAVTAKGALTLKKAGTAKITVARTDGKEWVLTLTVVDGAALSKTKASVNMGDTFKLTVSNLAGRKVTWSTGDKKIATVKDGTVTGVKAGKCAISAKVAGGKTLKCTVTVVDGAALSKTKASVKLGATCKLTVKKLAGRKVTWSTSDKKVATVKSGKITPVKAGKCVISAKVAGGKTLKCTVTVTDPAKLSATKLKVVATGTGKIKLTGAVGRKVTWSSSDAKVAKITKSSASSATVKGLKAGTTVIKAKVEGGKTLKCTVTVINPLTIKDNEDGYGNWWDWHLKFVNNSDKAIVYVKFNILQYDNRGVKLKSPYSYYYLNDTVWAHDYGIFYYDVNSDTRKIKIKITEVTFADKTKWKP